MPSRRDCVHQLPTPPPPLHAPHTPPTKPQSHTQPHTPHLPAGHPAVHTTPRRIGHTPSLRPAYWIQHTQQPPLFPQAPRPHPSSRPHPAAGPHTSRPGPGPDPHPGQVSCGQSRARPKLAAACCCPLGMAPLLLPPSGQIQDDWSWKRPGPPLLRQDPDLDPGVTWIWIGRPASRRHPAGQARQRRRSPAAAGCSVGQHSCCSSSPQPAHTHGGGGADAGAGGRQVQVWDPAGGL